MTWHPSPILSTVGLWMSVIEVILIAEVLSMGLGIPR